MNFLEQVAAEWYAIQDYFVRTNVKANRRPNGGWNNELDVLAYNPKRKELVHVETSWDAFNWDNRRERFTTKKFVFSYEQYTQLIGDHPKVVLKRAVVGTTRGSAPEPVWNGDIEVITVPNFIQEVSAGIADRNPMKDIIPETYPCLRAMQFILAYGS